jgi:hypothetical protein
VKDDLVRFEAQHLHAVTHVAQHLGLDAGEKPVIGEQAKGIEGFEHGHGQGMKQG